MILVDTALWIDHLRSAEACLASLLSDHQVLSHPVVVGELACGNLRNREEVLSLLSGLPDAPVADDREVLVFIEQHRLMGRGLGYIDVHLLAATALAPPSLLWTSDRRLSEAAARLGLAYHVPR